MKIGLVLDTPISNNAGVQQVFRGQARYLLDNGHDIRFLTPPSDNIPGFEGRIISFGSNVNIIGNTTSVPFGFHLGRKKVRQVLQKENFDIIHISVPFLPFLGQKVLSETSSPIVGTYMIYSANRFNKAFVHGLRYLQNNAFKKIQVMISSSDAAMQEAKDIIPFKHTKHHFIPHGVNTNQFSPSHTPIPELMDNKKNIIFLGRLEKRKGTAHLLKAYGRIKSQLPPSRLIIIGDGPLRHNLENLSQELGIQNDVIFTGYIAEELKPRYYTSADVAVFPALYGETFGMVLPEAMASGKVVLAYANAGYKSVLRNLPELLIKNGNIDQLGEMIIKTLTDDNWRQKEEEKCLKEAKSLSWDNIGPKIVNIYESLLS